MLFLKYDTQLNTMLAPAWEPNGELLAVAQVVIGLI
jgi:hypothetical protein